MSSLKALQFPKYNNAVVGTNNCVFKESLTSASDLGGATIAGTTPAGVTYDSDGIHLNKLAALVWDNTAISTIADLQYGFTWYMEVTSDWLTSNTLEAFDEYLVRINGGTLGNFFKRSNGLFRSTLGAGNIDMLLQGTTYPDNVPIWITGGVGWLNIYIDGVLSNNGDWDNNGAMVSLILGAGTTGTPSLATAGVRNMAVWSQSMIPLQHNKLIGVFGDSYTNYGSYPNSAELFAITASTPDGLTESTFYNGSTVGTFSFNESTLLLQLMRRLNKSGYGYNGDRITFWGCGGSGVIATSSATTPAANQTLGTRIDVAITGRYPIPDIPIIIIGANDVNDSGQTDASLAAGGAWQTAMQVEIDKLITAGTENPIVLNLMGRQSYTDGASSAVRLANINTSFAALTSCTVLDINTKMGGDSIDTAKLADNQHPNELGYVDYADIIYPELIKLLM